MIALLVVFWSAVAMIVYTYALFPALVVLRGRLWPRPVRGAPGTPAVSLIIAAHNEATAIGAKLDNALALDYPPDRLEVLVASDGSDDGTNDIVAAVAGRDPRVRLLALPRQGKAPALNAAVAGATSAVLVFSDANSMYRPDALRALVWPLADPEVGGVAGNQVYRRATAGPGGATGGTAAAGERTYWDFDRLVKHYESLGGNAISATGAIYAVRRELFRPVPGGVTDDFVTSTQVIRQGYRLVFAPNAVAEEPVSAAGGGEFARKVRITTRGFRSVIAMRDLLDPRQHGFYSLQLFTHKVLRRLVVFPLLALAVVSPLLWSAGWLYQLATLAQASFYACAIVAWRAPGTRLGRSKLCSLPFYFCLVNAAVLVAVHNILQGRRIERWDPQR